MIKNLNIYEILLIKLYNSLEWILNSPPKPHGFVNKDIKSTLDTLPDVDSISVILEQVNKILPQLGNFITQFNNMIISNNINVVTDSAGNLSIDVPANMSDSDAETISKKIGVIDRLIASQTSKADTLITKGLGIEQQLREINPEYKSIFTQQITKLSELKSSFKH